VAVVTVVRWFDALARRLGRRWLDRVETVRQIGAFTLITLGVTVTKFGSAPQVVRPLIRQQIVRSGIRLLPTVAFIGVALGLLIIGQTLRLLHQVGQQELVGSLIVTVLVRELSPLSAALVVLARVGTPTVVELGTARALGEVEALEALGIDPIHYLVVPRVLGITVAVFALSVYLLVFALVSGWLVSVAANVALPLSSYMAQIAGALRWQDFPLLAGKSLAFGATGALIACYQGLARPLRLEEVPRAATRTVAESVVSFLVLDIAFLALQLLTFA